MVECLRGSEGMWTKEDESSTGRVWAACISPCYGQFSLGALFEIYETFISFNFPKFFFSGRGKPRITETAYTESADTGGPPVLHKNNSGCHLESDFPKFI